MPQPLEKTQSSSFVYPSARKHRAPSSLSRPWSIAEIRTLRQLAEAGASMQAIAAKLHRTASAVRNKASFHGISVHSESRANPVE